MINTLELHIDPSSPEPIAAQLAYQVKQAIARGELSEGDKLPSVRALARRLTVNPNTIVRALDTLENEGAIVRRQGAGCFVLRREPALSPKHRRAKLRELLGRTTIEAFHLGFDPSEIRKELERALAQLETTSPGERS